MKKLAIIFTIFFMLYYLSPEAFSGPPKISKPPSSTGIGAQGPQGAKGDKGDPGEGIGPHVESFNHYLLHASGSDNQDLSGKVDKVTGKSLVSDTEITKIHASGSDNQDLSSYVLTNDARLSDARTPTTHGHAQSEVTDLAAALSGKEPANSNIQTHVTAAHAPSGAQINADITKAEIEAKLTGAISTHTHAGGGTPTQYNQSSAAQGAGFAADTYLVGSVIAIPASSLKIGSRYHLVFDVSKTAAGIAAPIITVRFGTNGSTADTARLTFTFLAQTAAADIGTFEIWATFRVVGASAVLQGRAQVRHRLSVTGLQNLVCTTLQVTSGAFDSAAANSKIGISVNGGTSAAWTVQLVQAELENLI